MPDRYSDSSGGAVLDGPELVDYATAEFRERVEPITARLVSETYYNDRNPILARQTDHEMLQPLPAPAARVAQQTYASTERPWGYHDPTIYGDKVDIEPGARPDPLQDMDAFDRYHTNTFRIEAEPWDETLIG